MCVCVCVSSFVKSGKHSKKYVDQNSINMVIMILILAKCIAVGRIRNVSSAIIIINTGVSVSGLLTGLTLTKRHTFWCIVLEIVIYTVVLFVI